LDNQSQILGHDAIFDDTNCGSLKLISKIRKGPIVIEIPAYFETTSPSEDEAIELLEVSSPR
jgi:hypothetical protein